MSIASGYKKFKKYILTSSGFQLVYHWTKANTLEFDDGKTAQDKLGAIDGISSSRESNSDKIAASTALVSELNSDLGGCQFGITSDGLPGYKKVGADTVYPFKNDFKVAKVTRSWSRWSADLGNNFRYDGSLVEQPDYKSFVIEKNLFLGIVYGRQRQVGIGIGPSISYNSTNGSFSLTTNGNWEITSCVLYIIRLN